MENKIRSTVRNTVDQFELDWATIKGIWWRYNREIKVTFFFPYKKVSECVIALQTLQECEKFFRKENVKTERGTGGIVLDTEMGSREVEIV